MPQCAAVPSSACAEPIAGFRYVNAGHNAQYALRGHGVLQQMESTGRPLGLLPGGGYAEGQLDLSDGDSLFLYTDGLVESENVAGEELGAKALIERFFQRSGPPHGYRGRRRSGALW